MAKKKKVRVELRKNRTKPPRDRTWTQQFGEPGAEDAGASADERVRKHNSTARATYCLASFSSRNQTPGLGPLVVDPFKPQDVVTLGKFCGFRLSYN